MFQLGGTVFAVIPNYYFRGFGTPVDAETRNVAKAGRAIPLKWQVFDETVAPVLDLDPAVVKLSSVAIPCESAGGSTDPLEEYAAGASGLQNLGEGVYQLNWATPKVVRGQLPAAAARPRRAQSGRHGRSTGPRTSSSRAEIRQAQEDTRVITVEDADMIRWISHRRQRSASWVTG